MASSEFRIISLSDEKVIEAIKAIGVEYNHAPGEIEIQLRVGNLAQVVRTDLANIENHEAIKTILGANLAVFQMIKADFRQPPGTSLVITRQPTFVGLQVNSVDEAPYESIGKLLVATQKHLPILDFPNSIQGILGEEMTTFYRCREESLVRLEGLSEKLIRQNEEYRRKLDGEQINHAQKLEEEFTARSQKLDEEYKKREELLTAKAADLDERVKSLDDRSSRHARRQIRPDLKSLIEDRNKDFRLTQATTSKRIIPHILFVTLSLMAGGALWFSWWELLYPPQGVDQSHLWYLLIRLPLSAIAFAAAVIYYIRWNDRWFQQHVDEELRLRRLDLDIDRASWVVEMALEWKDEKGTEIPKELLDRLSRNIFTDGAQHELVRHPSEDVLSRVLGASASLKIPIPGIGEATLDRKGLKTLKKQGTNEEEE